MQHQNVNNNAICETEWKRASMLSKAFLGVKTKSSEIIWNLNVMYQICLQLSSYMFFSFLGETWHKVVIKYRGRSS